ncbi:MAG: transglycosylase domain-containing protein [Candidatus Saccharibacteria bacterium]|nr:transglycosylase domain-containing protein [Candidatus Saccharibacteria bacterium]
MELKDVKKPKRSLVHKKGDKSMNVYSSLVHKKRAKKEAAARKRAEDLATLPKQPVARFFARLHPKRVAKFIFSKRGAIAIGKFIAACILLGIIGLGALFLYYKNDLESIRLDEMTVQETVNTYLDRNGNVLWEDKGEGDYRLVVDGDEISTYMRQATVAIEDKNFYNHPGVDVWGIIRAAFSTLSGRGVQGGSTLTQQLIKQLYFSSEAANRTVTGLPRKVKEMILALEVEKMYTKEQIITMYLNESPYGGRRNGVESAAQTYFNKTAKELDLAESALLAAIPNNPAVLNPYNTYANDALIARQQKVLDVMVEMGYITQEQADEAKAVDILDRVKPESSQYDNIKAPWFVLEVKQLLEDKYGISVMRSGGYTITTTLDIRAQEAAEAAIEKGKQYFYVNGSDNLALSSVDVETGQVIAMVGSVDWNNEEYGSVNATTALLEPGSTIKPVLDYGPLFMQRDGVNYSPGSILIDENIDKIYCAGYTGKCALANSTGEHAGPISIRESLANSLNIPAVKALYINGIENSLDIAHRLGDWSYCSDNSGGLSIAIGSGCGVKGVEHANAYASIARGGVYKELAYVLELKNSNGEVIEKWEDKEGERVYDEQVAYMLLDTLSDADARMRYFYLQARSVGFVVPNVWTASKTGTTTTQNAAIGKDLWFASVSTAVATTVWNGNHDGSGLTSILNNPVREAVGAYMEAVHKIYNEEGKWNYGDKPVRPKGIQTLKINGKTDIYPSWYNSKSTNSSSETLAFNKANKKLATECTPEALRVEISGIKTTDPVSGNTSWSLTDKNYKYDKDNKDDCKYSSPSVTLTTVSPSMLEDGVLTPGATFKFQVVKGSSKLVKYTFYVNGKAAESGTPNVGMNSLSYTASGSETSFKIVVTDENGVEAISSLEVTDTSGE